MAKLIGKKALHLVVSHQEGVRKAVHDEAKTVAHRAEALLEKARDTTHWHKLSGPSHLTKIKVEQGEVDSLVILEAPNAMAVEFGHEPSGYFAGTHTRAPHGLYILTHATGFTDLSG